MLGRSLLLFSWSKKFPNENEDIFQMHKKKILLHGNGLTRLFGISLTRGTPMTLFIQLFRWFFFSFFNCCCCHVSLSYFVVFIVISKHLNQYFVKPHCCLISSLWAFPCLTNVIDN